MGPAPPGDGGSVKARSQHHGEHGARVPASGPRSELLRLATVGSVDDGKSTLIGRLLHDTQQLHDDQLHALSLASKRRGVDRVDLSYVTDGLRAEREQGITIDVAYRYARTASRKLVVADCPGHVQYTRNMATGASTADLVVVVVDATTGLKEQTRRHCCIAALLGVRHMVAAVNKMDLCGWSQQRYLEVESQLRDLGSRLGMEVVAMPVCALDGDNVVVPSSNIPWYSGPTVLEALEQAEAGAWSTEGGAGARLPVQWVTRHPGGGRAYAGMLTGAPLYKGDEVVVLPAGSRSRVASIQTFDGPLDEATSRMSITVHLEDDLDVSRGDMIASAQEPPSVVRELESTLCWFGAKPASAGQRFRVKQTTRISRAQLVTVSSRLDVGSLALEPADELHDNEIGVATVLSATPLAVDPYGVNRVTGSFVVIDEATSATVAAGMVGPPLTGVS